MRAKPYAGRSKIRLGTLRDVQNELRRVYKAGVAKELPWQDATRAAHVLNIIAAIYQGIGVDVRLGEIETKLASVKPANGNGSAYDAGLHP